MPDSASFLTDYFHTVIILAIACYFTVQAFTNSDVDSVGKLYELVEAAGQLHPVSGNSQGSYLTMNSKSVWRPLSVEVMYARELTQSRAFYLAFCTPAPTSGWLLYVLLTRIRMVP